MTHYRDRVVRLESALIGLLALAFVWLGESAVRAQELKEFDTDYLESPESGPQLEEAETAIVDRTNEFREQKGFEPLKTDERLQKAASYFAAYMARTNKYGHGADGNRPSERVSLYDYNYCLVAENIAYQLKSTGFETHELADKFFVGWKESPKHRENMLQPNVTETGVAIGHAPGSDRYFAVQLFGRPRSAAIEFRVTNRSDEAVRYRVRVAGAEAPQAETREFDLPPRATMSHMRCRPASIDWGWTEEDDAAEPENGLRFVVTEEEGEIRVLKE